MMEDPEAPAPPEALAQPGPLEWPEPPERDPFWGYGDLLIFAGLTMPCLLLGLGMVKWRSGCCTFTPP